MFKNHLKIAWRNIMRHKAYSALNIAGLAIGMACSILILLWVQDELSYDRFNVNAKELYRLTCNAGDFKAAVTPAGMAEGLQSVMPEIKSTVRLSKPSTNLLEVENNKVLSMGLQEFSISSVYELIHRLDWLSLYVAEHRKVDMLNVPNIKSLKEFLDQV